MGMTVKKVTDPAFKAYGRVITGYDFSGLLKAMEQTPLPEDVIYIPSLPEMEALPAAKELENGIYGQMPIQIGCCNGHNSEVDIAVDDLILILGKQQDIEEDHTYDTSRMEAFLVPAGTAVEVYATTLHYAPCHVKDEGFRCVIVLPRDTNLDMEPVEVKDPEDRLLFARNKWLIGHAQGGLPEGAFIGLKGENLSV